jgi:hypothetical protein
MNMRLIFSGLAASAALCALPGTTRAQIFEANAGDNTIGEYTILGARVNATLISGLNNPIFIAVSGGNLFVANGFDGTIGEYTTSRATVNASLVSGLSFPTGIAASEGDLFVVNNGASAIGEYTTLGRR